MHIKTVQLKDKKEGEEVSIRGWVYRHRKLGEDKIFIVVRDALGIAQGVLKKDSVSEKEWNKAENLYIESSVVIRGKVKKDERAPNGVEIKIKEVIPISVGFPYPIQKDLSEDFLLDVRHLWLRSRKMQNIMRARHHIINYLREYLDGNGFYEITPPIITTAGAEGGAEMFEFDYFGKKAYLTQSSQLYSEVMIFSLEKVYTLAPSFRAEKSRTRKHLTEFWHLEPEMAFYSQEENMELQENLISYVAQSLLEEHQDILEFLKRDKEELREIKPPFKRIDYEKAIEIVNKRGGNLNYGDDFGVKEEALLTEGEKKPIFITNFPVDLKAFYMRDDPDKEGTVLAADVIAPKGHGEIIGGSERIYDYDELLEKMKRFNLNPKDYDWYLDLRRYGSVPHSGFGLGIERFVKYLLDLEHIRDAIPFPRTITRLKP